MPELPEVETIRRGIEPHVLDRRIEKVIVRDRRLRWPIARNFASVLEGKAIRAVTRRGKYLLLDLSDGKVILHMGMTGRLLVLDRGHALKKHDHLDIELDDGTLLRFNDPRRFGAALWWPGTKPDHVLIRHMGPEPFSAGFSAEYLGKLARGRRAPVKNFLMDGRVVVGVGNIYASESLFLAGIRPMRAAGKVTRAELARLVTSVRRVLEAAIEAGGTSFRDFRGSDGMPGYFAQKLFVYDRKGEPCRRCKTPIKQRVVGQRSTYYCPNCQT
jgi:formamidopyrimidine-DNA glycosylase